VIPPRAEQMVDRLATELEAAVGEIVPLDELHDMAHRTVNAFLQREQIDLAWRCQGAIRDIRRLTLRSARTGQRDTMIPKGQIFDVLDRWELR